MTTALFHHDACLGHDPGDDHPESAARLSAVLSALRADGFGGLRWCEAPRAEFDQLVRVHSQDDIDRIRDAVPASGRVDLDDDTVLSSGSWEAALRAAGAVCAAVDAVAAGKADNAFCAVRPPGHHAEPDRPHGFCLFNNVAIGALHARAVHRLGRVAVVDFDVHHGNGTQMVFAGDPDLFYASVHEMPLFPGTGHMSERGDFGNVVNAPLRPGAGSDAFRQVVGEMILPALVRFQPEIVLISAGFDGHADDPLADLSLQAADYGWITREAVAVARHACAGRVVSALEGGYALDAVAQSAAAHVGALMELSP